MLIHILRLLGLTLRRAQQGSMLDNATLDWMWEDDTIDIKNFRNMQDGPNKHQEFCVLLKRMEQYEKDGLYDWAEQIYWGIEDSIYFKKA